MSVTTVGYSTQAASVNQVLRTHRASGTTASGSADATNGTGRARFDRAEVSPMGQQFGELSQLQSQDPDKFKSLVSDMASQIRSLADQSTDENEQSMLTEMADRFDQAAESGDLKDMLPPPPPGPPPGGGASPFGQTDDSSEESTATALQPKHQRFSLSDDLKSQLDDLFKQFGEQVSAALDVGN